MSAFDCKEKRCTSVTFIFIFHRYSCRSTLLRARGGRPHNLHWGEIFENHLTLYICSNELILRGHFFFDRNYDRWIFKDTCILLIGAFFCVIIMLFLHQSWFDFWHRWLISCSKRQNVFVRFIFLFQLFHTLSMPQTSQIELNSCEVPYMSESAVSPVWLSWHQPGMTAIDRRRFRCCSSYEPNQMQKLLQICNFLQLIVCFCK